MLPREKLQALARRFREVESLLCAPDVLADAQRSRKLQEEHAALSPIVEKLAELEQVEAAAASAREALGDAELRELAQAELSAAETRQQALAAELRLLLLPRDPRDKRNVILEVRGGEGGEEGCLFAADLFRMLCRYAEANRWRVEIMSTSEAAAGGYKEIIALVSGHEVYSKLRFEGGVHRVQRVPATEAQGRIHTSTASVIVMPEADDVEVEIDERDLEINIAASGGPGGQGVNTTNSAVQIQHKPSGLIVKCQDERSQLKNKAKARKGMVQTAERSQKIRTYNFPQNRVTDHRIGLTLHKLDRVIDGDLEELVTALRTHHQAELLEREGLGAGAA